MNKLPNHTALKEWASVIEALDRGDQVVLIRKGGLADRTFGLEADRFYLFPTNYHDAGGGEPTRVLIRHWAEVVRTWQVHDLDRKSTRLNSSHSQISYAVFCLKKKIA